MGLFDNVGADQANMDNLRKQLRDLRSKQLAASPEEFKAIEAQIKAIEDQIKFNRGLGLK